MFCALFVVPTPASALQKPDFRIFSESCFTDRTSPKSFICPKYGQSPWKSRAGAEAAFPWEAFSRVEGRISRQIFPPTAEQEPGWFLLSFTVAFIIHAGFIIKSCISKSIYPSIAFFSGLGKGASFSEEITFGLSAALFPSCDEQLGFMLLLNNKRGGENIL